MHIKRSVIGVVVAGIAVAALAPVTLTAQGAAGKGTAQASGTLEATLYNWANHMGMLRGMREDDSIATLEVLGSGTINVGGQPCKLTSYRASVNYQTPGMRVSFACTRPDGQAHEEIRVVSGQFAWNEEGGIGGGLVPGKGKAIPMMNALDERLIELWSGPQGAVKAARAGGAGTKVAMEGGKTVVTYPVPGVRGAVAKATLTSGEVNGLCTRNCAERIEVRQGDVVTEFTYAGYADQNDPENRLDAFFPGHIVQKRGATTLLDLTVTKTETGNVYVVVPVPESIKKASAAGATRK